METTEFEWDYPMAGLEGFATIRLELVLLIGSPRQRLAVELDRAFLTARLRADLEKAPL
ncbi:MAG: hypothetical protein O3C25_02145 [Chloroflexi bacterium]|nr:hypothetical protein [Chloroflexota bacterium]